LQLLLVILVRNRISILEVGMSFKEASANISGASALATAAAANPVVHRALGHSRSMLRRSEGGAAPGGEGSTATSLEHTAALVLLRMLGFSKVVAIGRDVSESALLGWGRRRGVLEFADGGEVVGK
jgi:hypothetical protein